MSCDSDFRTRVTKWSSIFKNMAMTHWKMGKLFLEWSMAQPCYQQAVDNFQEAVDQSKQRDGQWRSSLLTFCVSFSVECLGLLQQNDLKPATLTFSLHELFGKVVQRLEIMVQPSSPSVGDLQKGHERFEYALKNRRPVWTDCRFFCEAQGHYRSASSSASNSRERCLALKNIAMTIWAMAKRLEGRYKQDDALTNFIQAIRKFKEAEECGDDLDQTLQEAHSELYAFCCSDLVTFVSETRLSGAACRRHCQDLAACMHLINKEVIRTSFCRRVARWIVRSSIAALCVRHAVEAKQLLAMAKRFLTDAEKSGYVPQEDVIFCSPLMTRISSLNGKAKKLAVEQQRGTQIMTGLAGWDDHQRLLQAWETLDQLTEDLVRARRDDRWIQHPRRQRPDGLPLLREDPVTEPMVLCDMGLIYHKVLCMKMVAKEFVTRALQLVYSRLDRMVADRHFASEEWYIFAQSVVKSDQEEENGAEDALEASTSVMQDLHFLQSRAKAVSVGQFLDILYRRHPPKHQPQLLKKIPSFIWNTKDQMAVYQKAIVDYHPLHTAENQSDLHWATQVMKILGHQYCFILKRSHDL